MSELKNGLMVELKNDLMSDLKNDLKSNLKSEAIGRMLVQLRPDNNAEEMIADVPKDKANTTTAQDRNSASEWNGVGATATCLHVCPCLALSSTYVDWMTLPRNTWLP